MRSLHIYYCRLLNERSTRRPYLVATASESAYIVVEPLSRLLSLDELNVERYRHLVANEDAT
jgi:hypothetical protein